MNYNIGLCCGLMAAFYLGCSGTDDGAGVAAGPGTAGASGEASHAAAGSPSTGGDSGTGGGDNSSRSGPPNVVLIVADDMGWGDLGAYGSQKNSTPALDELVAEGQQWTDFYVTASVCSPSRAALLTGRYQGRSGMYSIDGARALFAGSSKGLPLGEVTIAELLKASGYATGIFGKWHLGDAAEFLPTRQGFDRFFGLPYSHDITTAGYTPLLEGETEIEQLRTDEQRSLLTKRFTDEAIEFVRENRDNPFFLYLPHTAPHVPILPAAEFKGKSGNGDYSDVIMELDHHVGRLVDVLDEEGLTQDTLVIFTNDNGPWTTNEAIEARGHAGTPAPFVGGKFQSFEGSHRVPAIFRWPGTIPTGRIGQLGQTVDLLPTIASLTGVEMSSVLGADVAIDGVDLAPVLLGTGESPRSEIHYWVKDKASAFRKGPHKVHSWMNAMFDVVITPTACLNDMWRGADTCDVGNIGLREQLKSELAAYNDAMAPLLLPPAFDNQ